jgi:hypothetical protein
MTSSTLRTSVFDVPHRAADRLGAVERHLHLDGRRLVSDGDRIFVTLGITDPISCLDDVRSGLAPDDHEHRARPVHPGREPVVFDIVDYASDLTEPYRGSALVRDDDRTVTVRADELVVRVDDRGGLRRHQSSLGLIDGGARERAPHVFEADASAGELPRIDLHAHRRLLPAAD